jgi:hypothetical protein
MRIPNLLGGVQRTTGFISTNPNKKILAQRIRLTILPGVAGGEV